MTEIFLEVGFYCAVAGIKLLLNEKMVRVIKGLVFNLKELQQL